MTRLLAVAAALTALLTTACTEPQRAPQPPPTPGVTVINLPDGFTDVAAFCDGPNRVYAVWSSVTPAVVPNDPTCQEDR